MGRLLWSRPTSLSVFVLFKLDSFFYGLFLQHVLQYLIHVFYIEKFQSFDEVSRHFFHIFFIFLT